MILNVLNMFKQNSECKYWFKQDITILLKSVIFFQVFLGQKYGYRPLPTIIDAKELDMMRECVRDVPAEVELLDKWYKKDTNTVPPVYILQPISTILTNFNNKVSKISCVKSWKQINNSFLILNIFTCMFGLGVFMFCVFYGN